MDIVATKKLTIRTLEREDLGDVVAIDAIAERRPRRAYFERRLDAARLQPGLHAQFAACDEKGLAGYILARVLDGEFGTAAALSTILLVASGVAVYVVYWVSGRNESAFV